MQAPRLPLRQHAHYQRLKTQLWNLGPILQGTIVKRTVVRLDAQRREKRLGPYYQWTFKRKGKSVTVNLTKTQAHTYQQAIRNHRKLESLLITMRRLSLQSLERLHPCVARRKLPPKLSSLPLS